MWRLWAGLTILFATIGFIVVLWSAGIVFHRWNAHHSVTLEYPASLDRKPGAVAWQPSSPGKVRILSIDGGGSSGLAMIETLQALEKQAGRPIPELFDLVIGTSTGALIATLMTFPGDAKQQKYDLDKILDQYRTFPTRIFHASLMHRVLSIDGIIGPKFLNHERISHIRELYGEGLFGDLVMPVMITTYSQKENETYVFSNMDEKASVVPLSQILISATNAPTYFPGVKMDEDLGFDGYFLDGAVLAQNPALFAFDDVSRREPKSDIVLISVGVEQTDQTPSALASRGGAAEWVLPLIEKMMISQNRVSLRTLRNWSTFTDDRSIQVFRLAPTLPAGMSAFDGSPDTLDRLEKLGSQYVQEKKDEIAKAVAALAPGKSGTKTDKRNAE